MPCGSCGDDNARSVVHPGVRTWDACCVEPLKVSRHANQTTHDSYYDELMHALILQEGIHDAQELQYLDVDVL